MSCSLTPRFLNMTSPVRSQVFLVVRVTLVASAFLLLWVCLALWVRGYDRYFAIHIPLWLRIIGCVLAVAGCLLSLSCIVVFATKGQGTPAPFDPPRAFVIAGPYLYVRNPMYIGGIALILGAGLTLDSFSILLLAIIAFSAAHLFVVCYEEPKLTQLFGDNYLQYKSLVSRWLIRLPRR